MTATASTLDAALAAVRSGQPIVLRHGHRAEVVIAASRVTTSTMAFLVRRTSGFVCVALEGERLDDLHVPLMPADRSESTAYAVSVDLRAGTSTGISAHDRALTARALADPLSEPGDFARPGHVVPIRLRPGGVLAHPDFPEAAADLCRLAGLHPAAVLAAVDVESDEVNELASIRIDGVVQHRERTESPVRRVGTTWSTTRPGEVRITGYAEEPHDVEHLALVRGSLSGSAPVPVGVHVECVSGDVLGTCSCTGELESSLAALAEAGRGVLIYLRSNHEHGAGPARRGRERAQRSDRDCRVAAHILLDLGVRHVVSLVDLPEEVRGLENFGIAVADRAPGLAPIRTC